MAIKKSKDSLHSVKFLKPDGDFKSKSLKDRHIGFITASGWKGIQVENRTSDPTSPAIGQIWFRTDV